jgi:flavin reductase (DIM6/NTAB) family NADH-FMN oxidoreductase RutF
MEAMIFDCRQHSSDQNYFTLIQTVVPRPIAWVLSDNGNGSYNLAPFSFFNAIASEPPLIMLSVGWKDEAVRKDTWVNIDERRDFVVHIPSVGQMKDVVNSSATLAHGVSEVELLNLSVEKMEGQRLPKVAGPKIALFCEKYRIEEIGGEQQGLILGKVNQIWYSDDIVKVKDGRMSIDPKGLGPLARLGGSSYASLGEVLYMKRPA